MSPLRDDRVTYCEVTGIDGDRMARLGFNNGRREWKYNCASVAEAWQWLEERYSSNYCQGTITFSVVQANDDGIATNV